MRFHFIDEPKLEFGTNVHICPRAGITDFGVYDIKLTDRRDKIFVGAVGTNETLEKLNEWLEKCSEYIPGKPDAAQPNLFPAFCGFNLETGFKAEFSQDSRIVRALKNSDVEKILNIEDWNKRVEKVVKLYYDQIKFLPREKQKFVLQFLDTILESSQQKQKA
jgi:hypothetical protein